MSLIFINESMKAREFLMTIRNTKVLAVYTIASTKVSTIPGISIAGKSPAHILYTPAYDVEYLVYGVRGCSELPITPEGIPTPALITRACLKTSGFPYIIVNAGSFIEPKVPHMVLPSRCVGERIDESAALPPGTARRLFSEAYQLAQHIRKLADTFIIGESMPGGTTTSLSIMTALGYNAWDKVSSASPDNPHELKKQVVKKALKRLAEKYPKECDVFTVVDEVGDPLHISLAGLTLGLIENGAQVILAGGTQMCAVLAIMKKLKGQKLTNMIIGTTRWIVNDITSDIRGLVLEIAPEVPLVAIDLDFSKTPFEGLRYYERGFVKEGVGAGGTAIAVHTILGLSADEILNEIIREYNEVMAYVQVR